MLGRVNGELSIDSSVGSLKRTLGYLLKEIEESGDSFKARFMRQIQTSP